MENRHLNKTKANVDTKHISTEKTKGSRSPF